MSLTYLQFSNNACRSGLAVPVRLHAIVASRVLTELRIRIQVSDNSEIRPRANPSIGHSVPLVVEIESLDGIMQIS